jgi:hypothetical protein
VLHDRSTPNQTTRVSVRGSAGPGRPGPETGALVLSPVGCGRCADINRRALLPPAW